jgi:hypothetical protein
MLSEGGNVFKNQQGQPITQRINQTDIKPTLAWLDEMLPGLDLQDNMIGSTGLKPDSGDIDVAVDANKVTKEQLIYRLSQWAESHGFDPKDWVRKSGISVHFLTPITGNPDRGYVQTDFMFMTKPDWSKFILRGVNAKDRNILINSIAKSMGYKLNQSAGIADRATNQVISDDPDEIAKMLLNRKATRDDLLTVESVLKALESDPRREEKLADYQAHLEREGRAMTETVSMPATPYSEVSFLARLRDRIINQGMVPIMEAVRIEHPEDLVFDQGSRGLKQAMDGIKAAAQDPGSTTVKWDGKPAIIFGRKPTGEFVLTDKSGFGAKGYDGLATSPDMLARIMSQRGGERGELIAIYKKLFPLLRRAVPEDFRGYIQGDLLYANRPPVVNSAYEFQPNTVKYRVPAQSDLGQKIGASDAGVVIHTALSAPGSAATPIRAAQLEDSPGLLILDPSLREPRQIRLDDKVLADVQKIHAQHGRAIDQLFNPAELRARRITNLPQLLKTYINSRVRSGSYDNLISEFGPWLQQREPAKAPRVFEWANQNKTAMAAVFKAFLEISALKNSLVRQLDSQAQEVQASINDEPGHEGYVGQNMKFVDRMRFSAANFAKNNPDLAQ